MQKSRGSIKTTAQLQPGYYPVDANPNNSADKKKAKAYRDANTRRATRQAGEYEVDKDYDEL